MHARRKKAVEESGPMKGFIQATETEFRFRCFNRCIWRDRLWMPGDLVEIEAGELIPHHFEPVSNDGRPIDMPADKMRDLKKALEQRNIDFPKDATYNELKVIAVDQIGDMALKDPRIGIIEED